MGAGIGGAMLARRTALIRRTAEVPTIDRALVEYVAYCNSATTLMVLLCGVALPLRTCSVGPLFFSTTSANVRLFTPS